MIHPTFLSYIIKAVRKNKNRQAIAPLFKGQPVCKTGGAALAGRVARQGLAYKRVRIDTRLYGGKTTAPNDQRGI